jgi:hypothetical protein
MLVDLALELVTRHPLATLAVAGAAGIVSWFLTQGRTAG